MKASREFGLMLIWMLGWVFALQFLHYALHIFTAKLVGKNQPVPFKYRTQQSWYQLICYSVFSLVMAGGVVFELWCHVQKYQLTSLQTMRMGFSSPNPLVHKSLVFPPCAYQWGDRCLDVSWFSMLLESWMFADWPHEISFWMKIMYTLEAAFYVEQLFWLIHRTHRHWVWERETKLHIKTNHKGKGPCGGPTKECADAPDPPTLPLTSDHNMLILHHVVVLMLLSASFLANYTRTGVIVMIVHDISDPFLHMAKLCRYLGKLKRRNEKPGGTQHKNYETLQTVVFIIFAAFFLVGRLILLPRLLWGIWTQPQVYFQPLVYRRLQWTRTLWVAALSPLILLHVCWFYMILKAIAKALKEGSLKDGREHDGDEVSLKKQGSKAQVSRDVKGHRSSSDNMIRRRRR